MNGLVALKVGAVKLLLLKDEGMGGGGKVDVLEKGTLVDELNCSRVGGLFVLAKGFAARGAAAPNGFVAKRKKHRKSRERERKTESS